MLLYKGTIPTCEPVDELASEELAELLIEELLIMELEEITLLFEELLVDELLDEIACELELIDDELIREEELTAELEVFTDEVDDWLLLLELFEITPVDDATELLLDCATTVDVAEDELDEARLITVLDNDAEELRTELELDTTTETAELLTADDVAGADDAGVVGVESPPPPPPPHAVNTKARLQVAQVLVMKRIYPHSHINF